MKLKNIEFGNVFNASGARNFFGEGFWFHKFTKRIGMDWTGSTFVAKTTTIEQRDGNLPLLNNFQPKEYKPKCIKVNFYQGTVLNAVGLSGPGLEALIKDGRWQERPEPFLLSFMAVDHEQIGRVKKAVKFVEYLAPILPFFKSKIGLQVNFSCPNVGLDLSSLVHEARKTLDVLSALDIPLIPKFNATISLDAVHRIIENSTCSAISISNTIPYGKFPDKINWKKLFGRVSPLADIGGGGLSGAPLLPIVKNWILEAKNFPVPIIAGGGILSANDALSLIETGASAVELGSVAILRPWRVANIIKSINNYFEK
jgi:dihydroorotate dehydrogenase (NAD+) catalytic subunit